MPERQNLTQNARPLSETTAEWTKTIVGAFLAYVTFSTFAFANYSIPSESMVPHLEVGDRVAVSKFAYGYSRYSLPFDAGALLPAQTQRLFGRMPHRGDVVVFVHPIDGKVMIKRAIGLPGDTIEMREGELWINHRRVETGERRRLEREAYEDGPQWGDEYDEVLPGGVRHAVLDLRADNPFDNFGPYVVPEGRIFFMGDNRDNSLDSRWSGMGTAPIENLIGRAEIVYAAPRGCASDGAECPMRRWLRPLHH